jgi:hypothetical protein
MYQNRQEVAHAIAARLAQLAPSLKQSFASSQPVRHFVVDDLLDPDWVRSVASGFPDPDSMLRLSSIRERKRVGVSVDKYPANVGDALYAFHDPKVIEVVRGITAMPGAQADPTLYASGISVMSKADFLNPHIDNSHDGDGLAYRVLNLLFYVSPGWQRSNGGNLELWDARVEQPTELEARFNRLIVMETNQTSWHSVNKVRVDAPRRCVSNYYFSVEPPGGRAYTNVTTFTGRPEQPVRRLVLKVVDGIVLNTLGRTFPALKRRTKHRVKTAAQP